LLETPESEIYGLSLSVAEYRLDRGERESPELSISSTGFQVFIWSWSDITRCLEDGEK